MTINERIAKLRTAMEKAGIDAYYIPSADPHQSEYVAEKWTGRSWISGFTGSAGAVVITKDHAGLWTDGRYFTQGAEQLEGSEFHLHKMGEAGVLSIPDWIENELAENNVLGFDGHCVSVAECRKFKHLFSRKNITLQYDADLLDQTWEGRPGMPNAPVYAHSILYAGKSRVEKVEAIREKMKSYRVDYQLVSTLDDIAWTFNLRGSDVQCNPVFYSHALIGENEVQLFVDISKIEKSLQANLKEDGISLVDYSKAADTLAKITAGKTVLLNEGTISQALYNAIPKACKTLNKPTISTDLKGKKNKVEAQHIRETMAKDAVALTRTFMWMEKELETRGVKETEIMQQLAHFRSKQANYVGESFDAIVGYKGNGAIIHYRAEESTCATIQNEGVLLVDSGGQYLDGTTDITRTFAMGTATDEQKKMFTLVLKGHIQLAMCRFPEGTHGIQLDTYARMALWQDAANFRHGTGHGVGFFMNVHEGPHGIGPNLAGRYLEKMQLGQVTSNEPGYYKVGEFGIRIENLVLTVEDVENENGKFFKFETLTLFPIDHKLIEKSLLTDKETQWLNDYHRLVLEKVLPLLDTVEEKEWLRIRCKAI